MSEMKLLRLTSSEEVIGKVTTKFVGDTITSYVIEDGYSLIAAGEGRIGFIPFMAYASQTGGVEIDAKFVMFCVNPVTELLDQIKQMSSGLDLSQAPPKKIVMQ